MNKLSTLIIKNFKLLIRSKSSALVILVGPLLIMLLTGLAFNNTNIYNINIGVFSEDYTELTYSFIEKLRTEQFTVLKTISEDACINKIKEGHFHICIVFPKDLALNQETQNQITFYVDYSRINLVWMVIDTISAKISERSSELSLNLTTSIVDVLKEVEMELSGKDNLIDQILNDDTEVSSEFVSIKELLNSMDISFNDNEFNTADLSTKNNQLDNLSKQLKNYGINTTDEVISLVADIETEVNSLNISSSEKNIITSLTSQIEDDLKNLKSNITSTYTSSNTLSNQIDSLLSTISGNLNSLKSRLNSASTKKSDILTKISSIESKLSITKTSLITIQSSIHTIKNSISALTIMDATAIASPTTTNIKPVTTEKSHLNYFFPSLIALVIMFIAILLGSSLVMMEKTSRAHFRDYISPTSNLTFFFSTYLTCIIIMFVQLIILFIISLLVFKLPISIFSTNFLSIFILSLIIATLFTILGMFVGYAFKSRETATLGAMSLSSIFFIISDLILPIESMPKHLLFLAKLNPFMLSSTILRKTILFGKNIFSLGSPLYLILFYVILLFTLSIIMIGFLKRQHFISIQSKPRIKRERQKKHR